MWARQSYRMHVRDNMRQHVLAPQSDTDLKEAKVKSEKKAESNFFRFTLIVVFVQVNVANVQTDAG